MTLVSLSHVSHSDAKPPCFCLCLYMQHLKVVFWTVVSCVVYFELFFFLPTLVLKKDCERAERESRVTQIMFKSEKTKLPLLMAGPDVNRNGKVQKEVFPQTVVV